MSVMLKRNHGNTVGIATDYGLDYGGAGFRFPGKSRIVTSTYCLYRIWGPPSLLCSGYRGLFPHG
jgi:hypothetical protein